MKRRLYFAAPFIVLPLAARLFVVPIGDSLASAATRIAPSAHVEDEVVASEDDEPAARAERRAERGRTARHAASPASARRPEPGAPVADAGGLRALPADAGSRGTIVVPAQVVAHAVTEKKVGARDAVDENGNPVGARIHGVGRYKTGLQNGDIIVSVGGTPTPTTTALVDVAMKIIGAGATKLTGKIRRGDTLYDVVLELPPRDP